MSDNVVENGWDGETERRHAGQPTLSKLSVRLEKMEQTHSAFQRELRANTDMTKQTADAVKEIVHLLNSIKIAGSFLTFAAQCVRISGGLALAVAAIWGLLYAIGHDLVPQAFSVITGSGKGGK